MLFYRRLPEEETAKVLFTHSVYKQLLEFMVVQGALLSHVEPKYLMSYEEYCVYCKSNTPSSRSIDVVSCFIAIHNYTGQLNYDKFALIKFD